METKNNGFALLTVLLLVVVLEIIAVVSLSELGYSVINAGNNKTSEYAYDTSNAAINAVFPVILSGGQLGGSLTVYAVTSSSVQPGNYYYTTSSSGSLSESSQFQSLEASNLLSSSLSQKILSNSGSQGQAGFEYEVDCGEYNVSVTATPSYVYNYIGHLYTISRFGSNSNLVETEAIFYYEDSSSPLSNCPTINVSLDNIDPENYPSGGIVAWYQWNR